jgi:hypothetical protein
VTRYAQQLGVPVDRRVRGRGSIDRSTRARRVPPASALARLVRVEMRYSPLLARYRSARCAYLRLVEGVVQRVVTLDRVLTRGLQRRGAPAPRAGRHRPPRTRRSAHRTLRKRRAYASSQHLRDRRSSSVGVRQSGGSTSASRLSVRRAPDVRAHHSAPRPRSPLRFRIVPLRRGGRARASSASSKGGEERRAARGEECNRRGSNPQLERDGTCHTQRTSLDACRADVFLAVVSSPYRYRSLRRAALPRANTAVVSPTSFTFFRFARRARHADRVTAHVQR